MGVEIEETATWLDQTVTLIVVSKLRRFGLRDHDVDDCRNDVLMFLEKRLQEPLQFELSKPVYVPPTSWRSAGKDQLNVLQLLRREPFTVSMRPRGLSRSEKCSAQFQDGESGTELVTIPEISWVEGGLLSARLPYERFEHEQIFIVALLPNGGTEVVSRFAAKVLKRETFESRMRFITATAQNRAREYVRPVKKERNRLVDNPDAVELYSAPVDEEKQHIASMLAEQAISQLPPRLLKLARAHHIENRSWAEIAHSCGISESKAKKDYSRAVRKVAKKIVETEPEAAQGAVHRVVRWLKDMLPYGKKGK